jgi:DNA-binding LytR/AlgR family response regulator
VEWFKSNEHPQIVLLDIQLSDGLSFEIFKQVKIASMIIFTTAYDEYAIQAFRVNSIDYLLKPVEKDELESAFKKYKEYSKPYIQEKNASINLSDIASLIKSKNTEYRKRILIQSNESFVYLSIEEVAIFYSMHGVTFALTFEKRKYPINFSLESLKSQIDPEMFFKVNRQIIININCIKRVHSYFNGKLKLETIPAHPKEVVIGKDKASTFRKWLDR